MYVCICNAVTDSDIVEAQRNGHTRLKDLTRHLGVGNCCGRCIETARDVLRSNEGVKTFMPSMSTKSSMLPA